MQLHQEQRDISSGGIATQRKMSMNLDGTAFKILSDGLYSNKIGSVVRETASNAYDSHIEAGIPTTPIEIELPTVFNPTFVVRDFGIGLDEEGVLSVATTYFSSTKRSDNKAIGGFGLGFKSPFSYTDQFTIVAVYEGVKRTFSAYMDSSGEPSVALLSSEETDDTNGVEVRVPVKNNDLSLFEAEVKKQLEFFDPRPSILGRPDFEWPAFNPSNYQAGEYAIVPYDRYPSSGWRVVSGPVSFPLDRQALEQRLDASQWRFITSTNGIIFVNVGDVIPAPSRESLQYNDHTLDTLVSKVTHLCSNVVSDITSEIEDSKSFLEATEKYCKLTKSIPWQTRELVKPFLNGVQVTGQIDVFLSDHTVRSLSPSWVSDTRPKLDSMHNNKVVYNPDYNTLYFHDDLPNAKYGRQAARCYKYYVDNNLSYDSLTVIRGDINEFTSQIDGFDPADIVKLSDCPPPTVKTGTSRAVASTKIANRERWDQGGLVRDAKPVSTLPDGGVYAITTNGDLTNQDAKLLRSYSPIKGDIYLVPKTLSKAFIKDDNWLSVEEERDRLRSEADLAEIQDQYDNHLMLCNLYYQSYKRDWLVSLEKIFDKIPSALSPTARYIAKVVKEARLYNPRLYINHFGNERFLLLSYYDTYEHTRKISKKAADITELFTNKYGTKCLDYNRSEFTAHIMRTYAASKKGLS